MAGPNQFLEEEPSPIDDPRNNLSITMFYKKKGSLRSDKGVPRNELRVGLVGDSKKFSSLKNKSTLNKKGKFSSFSQKFRESEQNSGFDLINKDSLEMGKATPGFYPYSNSQQKAETEGVDVNEVSFHEHLRTNQRKTRESRTSSTIRTRKSTSPSPPKPAKNTRNYL